MELKIPTGGKVLDASCPKCCIMMQDIAEERSHCCLEEVMVCVGEHPYFCARCRRPCELAEPNTPSHEETLRIAYRAILKKHSEGKMAEQDAVDRLEFLCKEQVQIHAMDIAEDLVNELKDEQPVIAPMESEEETYTLGAICRGYELACDSLQKKLDVRIQNNVP